MLKRYLQFYDHIRDDNVALNFMVLILVINVFCIILMTVMLCFLFRFLNGIHCIASLMWLW